jgi:hypothetical protein
LIPSLVFKGYAVGAGSDHPLVLLHPELRKKSFMIWVGGDPVRRKRRKKSHDA